MKESLWEVMRMNLTLTDAQITVNGVVSHCKCKCAHCLLESGEGILGDVPFGKLRALAMKFLGYREKTGVDVAMCAYNCSDYPELPIAMETDRLLSKYHGYQNLNGTPIRTGRALADWVTYLKNDCGVTHANLSWFGLRDFHDSFVRAPGYFDYLLDLAAELHRQEVPYSNSVFILKSNLGMLDELSALLSPLGGEAHFSLLDYKGAAKRLLREFLTDEKELPAFIVESGRYNINRNRMNSAWVKAAREGSAPEYSRRYMFLVATPENIDEYLSMTADELVEMMHEIDRRMQDAIPSVEFLAREYGKSAPEVLVDFRSAVWLWTDLYFRDAGIDEGLAFSDLHTSVMWR
jgi:hypothetical protein